MSRGLACGLTLPQMLQLHSQAVSSYLASSGLLFTASVTAPQWQLPV